MRIDISIWLMVSKLMCICVKKVWRFLVFCFLFWKVNFLQGIFCIVFVLFFMWMKFDEHDLFCLVFDNYELKCNWSNNQWISMPKCSTGLNKSNSNLFKFTDFQKKKNWGRQLRYVFDIWSRKNWTKTINILHLYTIS